MQLKLLCGGIALGLLAAGHVSAGPSGQSGTTLAAVKTVGICSLPSGDWRYFGEISVWNTGAIDTVGLVITDTIQNKLNGPSTWVNRYTTTTFDPPVTPPLTVIPAGTTLETATVFKYAIEGAPLLAGDIRNVAKLTITHHSGSNVPKGPEPKATDGLQRIIDQATSWLQNTVCQGKGNLCAGQKDWAAIIDTYNNGLYPEGPPHCAE
jgi:hypothetical protein